MSATEALDYSTTVCSRCGDRERLIVRTRSSVVSRCYVCGDEASWVTAVRAPAPTGTAHRQPVAPEKPVSSASQIALSSSSGVSI
jgi:hypothetical protein